MKRGIRIALYPILLCVLCGCSNASVSNHTTNQTQNTEADRLEAKEIRSPGLIAKINDKIYFSNYDKQKNVYSVMESNLDGSNPKTIFTDDAMFDGLFAVDDHTLCLQYELPYGSEVGRPAYYLLDLKTKTKKPLFNEEDIIWSLVYDGDSFYYDLDVESDQETEELCSGLYKMKLNSDHVLLKKDIDEYEILKDVIYYTKDGSLYQMNLDGKNREKVAHSPENSFFYGIHDNKIFYTVHSWSFERNDLYLSDINKQNKIILKGYYAPYTILSSDTAFYIVEKILIEEVDDIPNYDMYLTKISYDGKQIMRLTKMDTEDISLINDWIYFQKVDEQENMQIYRIHKDGENPQKITNNGFDKEK